MKDAGHGFDQRAGNGGGDVFERKVGSDERHPQSAACEHHDDLFGLAFFGEVLGVAAEEMIAGVSVVDDAFVQRRSNHAVEEVV